MSSLILWILALCISFMAVFIFRKKRKGIYIFTITLLIGGVVIGAVGLLPQMKETVEIKALGTANEKASQTEIVINSITVDKDIVEIEPTNGKWFWRGAQYMWRPENDNRKPEGVTASVTLNIPVGTNRSIQLEYGPWRGMVDITYNSTKTTVDTYALEKTETDFILPSSSSATLFLDIGRRVMLFLFVYAVCLLIAYVLWSNAEKYPEKVSKWITTYGMRLSYCGIAAAALFLMIAYSGQASFWGDEMIVMGIISPQHSILDVINYNLNLTDGTPPLFNILAFIWYRIVPFGEQWLRLLPEISTALGIVFVGLCGERMHKKLGLWASVIAATSMLLVLQCGYEFRSYCFLFLFSAITLERFLNRLQCDDSKRIKAIITLGIAMTMLSFSHFYGLIICFGYFVFDCYLFSQRKIKLANIISYIILGVPIGIYLLAVVLTNSAQRLSYPSWYTTATVTRFVKLYDYLNSSYMVTTALFIFGLVSIFSKVTRSRKLPAEFFLFSSKAIIILQLLVSPAVMFIVGRVLPITYWLERYFVGMLPFVFLVSAYPIAKLCESANHESRTAISPQRFIAFFLSGILVCNAFSGVSEYKGKTNYPYRQAAEWLISQNDIYVPTTTVLLTREPIGTQGFRDYYVGQNGKRDIFDVLPSAEVTIEELSTYNTIYVFEPGQSVGKSIQEYLNEHFNKINAQSSLKISVYQRK